MARRDAQHGGKGTIRRGGCPYNRDAFSTGIGSDTQKPFAIVVVTGLISRLFLGFFVNPVLYEMVAKEGDVLQV